MSVDPSVLEKLRKVLVLAAQGATEGEMQAAMARAKDIALKYNVDLASVALEDPKKVKAGIQVGKDDTIKTQSKYVRKHHNFLFWIVKDCFGVDAIINVSPRGSRKEWNRIWFVGESNDLVIAKEVFRWLDELFPELFRKYVKQGDLDNVAADAYGFYKGLALGIIERNARQEAEQAAKVDKNAWALVVRSKEEAVQEFKKQEFPNLKDQKVQQKKQSIDAMEMGQAEGRKLTLKQTGAGSQNNQIGS